MLCASSNGYLWSFNIYSGADTDYPPPSVDLPKSFNDYSNPSKIVLSLAEGLYGQGYCIIVDNLYTSPELLLALYKNNVDCYGTLRKKKGLPKDFWSWKPKKEVGVEPIRKFCDQKFMIMRWNDAYKTKSNKTVSLMSTKDVDELVKTGKIHFQSKAEVRKPNVIFDYNFNMGGVNNLSQVIIPNNIQRKGGHKWYRKIVELFNEIAIYSAFVIFQKSHQTMQLTFRQELIRELLMYHLHGAPTLKAGHGDQMNLNSNPLRLVGRHFISTRDHSKKCQRYRCVRQTASGIRKDTIYQCRKCDVALCIFRGFEIYHANKDFLKVPTKLTLLFEKFLSHLKVIANI